MASERGVEAAAAGLRIPIRATFAGGCAAAASGVTSRFRMSVTRHPMALHHMIISSRLSYANLSMEAVACRPLFGADAPPHHGRYSAPSPPRSGHPVDALT